LNDNGNVGLFSFTVHGSTIENLNLTDIDLTLTSDTFGYAGGLVANNGGTISNVNVSGSITGLEGPAAGGLVGFNNSGAITNCSSAVNISVNIYGSGSAVGGFVGDNEGSISDCYSTGNVTISGQSENTSAATAKGAGVGGFDGYQGSLGSISYAYATGGGCRDGSGGGDRKSTCLRGRFCRLLGGRRDSGCLLDRVGHGKRHGLGQPQRRRFCRGHHG
jgi:hypothetical protein